MGTRGKCRNYGVLVHRWTGTRPSFWKTVSISDTARTINIWRSSLQRTEQQSKPLKNETYKAYVSKQNKRLIYITVFRSIVTYSF